jgi:hypothetical protein
MPSHAGAIGRCPESRVIRSPHSLHRSFRPSTRVLNAAAVAVS